MDYVISDLHFNHGNIIKFERSEFSSIEEHNEYIIHQWNSTIKNENDKVYVLGDVGFHGKEEMRELISRLRGYKILIKGNHDVFSNSYYERAGFQEVYDHPIYYNKKVILSHEPVKEALDNPYIYNIHGHLHNETVLVEDNFYCVSAKYVKYKPMKLTPFVNRLPQPKSRKECLGNEWYFDYYDFNKYKLQITNNRPDTLLTLKLKEDGVKGTFVCGADWSIGSFNKCIIKGYKLLGKTKEEISCVFDVNGGFTLSTSEKSIHFMKY